MHPVLHYNWFNSTQSTIHVNLRSALLLLTTETAENHHLLEAIGLPRLLLGLCLALLLALLLLTRLNLQLLLLLELLDPCVELVEG